MHANTREGLRITPGALFGVAASGYDVHLRGGVVVAVAAVAFVTEDKVVVVQGVDDDVEHGADGDTGLDSHCDVDNHAVALSYISDVGQGHLVALGGQAVSVGGVDGGHVVPFGWC